MDQLTSECHMCKKQQINYFIIDGQPLCDTCYNKFVQLWRFFSRRREAVKKLAEKEISPGRKLT